MEEAAESRLTQLHEGTPGLVWLGDAAISRYSQKHAFLCVFSRPAKISKWRHFRSYRRFAVMFEQAELRGTQVGPNGPPNAKKWPKSPQKSLF